jgi:hypothetical protein
MNKKYMQLYLTIKPARDVATQPCYLYDKHVQFPTFDFCHLACSKSFAI